MGHAMHMPPAHRAKPTTSILRATTTTPFEMHLILLHWTVDVNWLCLNHSTAALFESPRPSCGETDTAPH